GQHTGAVHVVLAIQGRLAALGGQGDVGALDVAVVAQGEARVGLPGGLAQRVGQLAETKLGQARFAVLVFLRVARDDIAFDLGAAHDVDVIDQGIGREIDGGLASSYAAGQIIAFDQGAVQFVQQIRRFVFFVSYIRPAIVVGVVH